MRDYPLLPWLPNESPARPGELPVLMVGPAMGHVLFLVGDKYGNARGGNLTPGRVRQLIADLAAACDAAEGIAPDPRASIHHEEEFRS